MILDRTSLSRFDLLTGSSHILPADISGRNPFAVQLEFMQAFAMPDFLFPYLKYRITGNVEPDMKRMNPYGRIRDSKNNDAFNPREKQIEQEGEEYWEKRKNDFPEREGTAIIAEPAIFHRQRMVLDEIMEVLRQHGTSIYVLISPDYNQKNYTRMIEKSCKVFSEKRMCMISAALTNLQKITITIMRQDTIVPCWAVNCWKEYINVNDSRNLRAAKCSHSFQ